MTPTAPNRRRTLAVTSFRAYDEKLETLSFYYFHEGPDSQMSSPTNSVATAKSTKDTTWAETVEELCLELKYIREETRARIDDLSCSNTVYSKKSAPETAIEELVLRLKQINLSSIPTQSRAHDALFNTHWHKPTVKTFSMLN
jgi:hypothetical protein